MKREEFNNLLKKANLSKKEFCGLLDISYPSVNNWGSGKDVPYWVKSWLENYIDKKRFENMKDIFKDSGACE